MADYSRAMTAAQQAAWARAAAARRERLQALTSPVAQRLAAAERAFQDGDIAVASRLYMSVARTRPPNHWTAEAKEQLQTIENEAIRKLEKIDAGLFGQTGTAPQVQELFRQYDQLADAYGSVPAVKRQIRSHVAQQRRRPEFAAVLNEPKAKALWEAGREHESQQALCCAYWAYEEAAKLVPAPSANKARERLAEMKRDPQIVASAEACRQLQECHRIYNRAVRLIPVRPDRARELFAGILEQAPPDSTVYLTASQQVEELSRQ